MDDANPWDEPAPALDAASTSTSILSPAQTTATDRREDEEAPSDTPATIQAVADETSLGGEEPEAAAEEAVAGPSTSKDEDKAADGEDDDDDFDFQDAADPNTATDDFDDFGDFDEAAPAAAIAAPSKEEQGAPASVDGGLGDEPTSRADATATSSSGPPAPQAWSALPDPRTLKHDDVITAVRAVLEPALSTHPEHAYPYHSGALASGAIQPAAQAPIKPKTTPHARTGVLSASGSGGAAQAMWDDLVSRPAKGYKPVSWARSGARRRLYTALGVPINLDEELPPSMSGSLPPLKISLGPSQGDGGENGRGHRRSGSGSGSGSGERGAKGRGPSSSSNSGRSTPQPGMGPGGTKSWRSSPSAAQQPPPPLDLGRIEAIVNMSATQLSMLPLSAVKTLADELRTHTVSTSAALAYYLQRRDTLAHDADTYNTMIRDLVAGAASRLASGGSSSSSSSAAAAAVASSVRTSTGAVLSPTSSTAPSSAGWTSRTPRSSTPLGR